MTKFNSLRLSNSIVAQLRRAVRAGIKWSSLTADSKSNPYMRTLLVGGVAAGILAGGTSITDAATIPTWVQESSAAKSAPADEPRIAFAYQDEDWETVIKDFVEQTQLTLFPYSDYPEDSFTLLDGKSHSLKEGLDILNHNLLLKGFVLIRFGDQLILVNHVEDGFPDPLIEQVAPEELADRGMFDLVYTRFNVKGLDLGEISDQVTDLIDPQRGKVVPLESANELRVRENVRVLLTVKDVIEKAQAAKKATFKMRNLEFIPYETLMRIVRPEFELDEASNRSKDGSLSIALGSGETQIWVTGEADRVDAFMSYVEQLDVAEFKQAEGQTTEYRLASYSPATDPAMAYKIVQNIFDGRADMNMSLSEESGVFYVKGREQDHEQINEILKTIAADGMQLAVIQCNVLDTDEMIDYIKVGLGMSTGSLLDDDKASSNVKLYFIEDSINDNVIIRGTLPLITAAKEIAETIDPVKVRGQKETKPYVRLQYSDDQDIEAAIREFEATWGGGVNRPNKVEIVAPSERGGYSGETSESNTSNFRFPSWDRQRGTKLDVENLTPEQINQLRRMLQEEAKRANEEFTIPTSNTAPKSGGALKSGDAPQSNIAPKADRPLSFRTSINPIVGAYIQEDETTAEAAQDETTQAPTPVFKHEPGAPIFIEQSANGEITIRSNDREALSIAADLMADILKPIDGGIDEFGLEQRVTFLIGFRSAEELAGEIEEILGLSGGGGGGGGGGMGGMMGNIAQNVVGGAAGDMIGGLLGGGGLGGGSGGDRTTGDVSIHVDNFLNAMIVYANESDLAEIESLIQLKDRPTAPHDPMVNGETRRIRIEYRDPEVIKTQVETLFADIIRKPETPGQGGGQQPNPAELLKQMMGNRGGRGGGGGGGGEAAKPKISLTVDAEAKLLVVMGPGNLCDQVEQFVKTLDFEDALPKKQIDVMAVPVGMNIEMLKTVFPNAVQASGGSGSGAQATSGASSTPTTGRTGGTPFQLPANFGGFGNRGGGNRGGGNRGGGNRGGGNRGGGGRGGR